MSLLEVKDLVVEYEAARSWWGGATQVVTAVNRVSFELGEGETLGIVGESGCGKSSLAKTLMLMQRPRAGSIQYRGRDVLGFDRKETTQYRRDVQMVFQDPYGSLNPKLTVGQSIAEGLEIHRLCASRPAQEKEVGELLKRVGLDASSAQRYPHEFSGGQRQRIGIARALAVRPKLVICDEPVSALDVSVQAQVVNLLRDLQDSSGLSYLFITHDLAVVEHISQRLLVLYLGQVVEQGPAASVIAQPMHPYTQALVSAVPGGGRGALPEPLSGEVPSPLSVPPGCPFQSRCPQAEPRCARERPALRTVAEGREVACHAYPETVEGTDPGKT